MLLYTYKFPAVYPLETVWGKHEFLSGYIRNMDGNLGKDSLDYQYPVYILFGLLFCR